MEKKNRKKHPFFPSVIWTGIMFVGYSIPVEGLGEYAGSHFFLSFILSEKSLHFIAFGIFAWFLSLGFLKSGWTELPFFIIFLLAMGYGLFIEMWQAILPYRSFGVDDLVFDFLGVMSGMLVFLFTSVRNPH